MSDAAPPPTPFDPPGETIAEAVSEQLDFASRLDVLERKVQAVLLRLGHLNNRVSSLQVDVGRIADAATAGQGTLEKLERVMGRIAVRLGVSQ